MQVGVEETGSNGRRKSNAGEGLRGMEGWMV